MIDYIKIMNLIIAFVKSTAIPVDLNSLTNNNDIKIPVIHKVMISKGTLDNFISISIIILLLTFAINCLIAIIFASDKENEGKNTAIGFRFFTVAVISFFTFIPLFGFSKHVDDKYDEIRNSIKLNYYAETVPSYQLETANTLPNGDMTKDDILRFEHFAYDKPDNYTIYAKGNLYDLPIPTLLKEANIQSIKNLYENIQYLDNYYDTNYIEDTKYHWINTWLNAFYNSNPVDNTNADILKNLKN